MDEAAYDVGPVILTGRFKSGQGNAPDPGTVANWGSGGGGLAPAPAPAPGPAAWEADMGNMVQLTPEQLEAMYSGGNDSGAPAPGPAPAPAPPPQPADLTSMFPAGGGLGQPPAGSAPMPEQFGAPQSDFGSAPVDFGAAPAGGAAAAGSIMGMATGWVLACTSSDESPSPPEVASQLAQAVLGCQPPAVAEVAQ